MEHGSHGRRPPAAVVRRAAPALKSTALEPSSSEEDELREAFGRVLGFTIAAFVLLLGGGIFVILVAGIFFGFLYGS